MIDNFLEERFENLLKELDDIGDKKLRNEAFQYAFSLMSLYEKEMWTKFLERDLEKFKKYVRNIN